MRVTNFKGRKSLCALARRDHDARTIAIWDSGLAVGEGGRELVEQMRMAARLGAYFHHEDVLTLIAMLKKKEER